MSQSTIDEMMEFALTILAREDLAETKSLPRRLARRWPEQSGLLYTVAILSAAVSIDDFWTKKSEASALATKLAALLAADVCAVEMTGILQPKGSDLLAYWTKVDPYFLRI